MLEQIAISLARSAANAIHRRALAGPEGLSLAIRTCMAEVTAGLSLIVSLFTPRRNIILLVLYWQYLQMRYLIEVATGMTGGVLHQAFTELDRRIMGVLMKLPSPVLQGYNLLKALLARQVTLPDPNQPSLASSLSSKCAVM